MNTEGAERRLLLAVLLGAVEDLGSERPHLRRAAVAWLSGEVRTCTVPASMVCEALGLSPRALAQLAR